MYLKFIRSVFVFCLLFFSFCLFGQNNFKNKQRAGYWITFYDSAQTKPEIRGQYKNGIQKGKWLYYAPTGELNKKEIYRKKNIKVSYFYPNGKIQRKGMAKLILSDTLYHCYFEGEWKCFTKTGELQKKQFYNKGELKNEVHYKTSEIPFFNDSLTKAIKSLYNDYYKYNDSSRYVYKNYGKLTSQYIRMKKLEYLNDSSILSRLDYLIKKYGYPSKEIVGEEFTTPFFLISSYGLDIKDKYYDLIISASNNNILDKKDVAFFVDKVKVAHKLPQVYGTQYMYKKELEFYYPIENPTDVNFLRKKVGLDELELKGIKFTTY